MSRKKLFAVLVMSMIAPVIQAQNWLLNGNSNTVPGTNPVGSQIASGAHFVGTLDNNGLMLGTNNTNRAFIDLSGNMYGGSSSSAGGGASNSFAWGTLNTVTGSNAAAFGGGNTCAADYSTAMGQSSKIWASGGFSAAFGAAHDVSGPLSFVAGYLNTVGAGAQNSVTFGYQNKNYAFEGFVTGQSNTLQDGAQNSSVLGLVHNVYAKQAFVSGEHNFVSPTATNSTTLGSYNSNSGLGSIVAGGSSGSSGSYSIVLGYNSSTAHDYAMAIGSYAQTSANNQLAANFTGGYNLMGGNVGIGATDPRARLHVQTQGTPLAVGNTGYTGDMVIEARTGGRNTAAGASLEFVLPASSNPSNPNPWGQARIIAVADNTNDGDATGRMVLGTRRSSNGVWSYGNDIIIDGLGHVTVGTPSSVPQNAYILNVWGNVRANKLTVNTTGADFVFGPSYKLRPLAEVERYVKANRHLPEVASAEEMEKNGTEVGEVQTRLLQKVEELTLYAISQGKKQAGQQKLIAAQARLLLQMQKKFEEMEKRSKQHK